MSHPFDTLPLPKGGAFIFTPCPGTKTESVTDSLARLQNAGASALVTLLSDEELAFLDVASLGSAADALGLAWFQLPIEDDHAPEAPFNEALSRYRDALLSRLEAGETLIVHCRGGTGRTGLMAAVLLLEQGLDWPSVKTLIQSVRPKALTLPPQLAWLKKHYDLA